MFSANKCKKKQHLVPNRNPVNTVVIEFPTPRGSRWPQCYAKPRTLGLRRIKRLESCVTQITNLNTWSYVAYLHGSNIVPALNDDDPCQLPNLPGTIICYVNVSFVFNLMDAIKIMRFKICPWILRVVNYFKLNASCGFIRQNSGPVEISRSNKPRISSIYLRDLITNLQIHILTFIISRVEQKTLSLPFIRNYCNDAF